MANTDLKNWWLYVLQLNQEKWYVGITSKTPEIRIQQHVSGFAGAAWTKKYKPLQITERIELGRIPLEVAEFYENKKVREYIKIYGLKNVRGGDLRTPNDLLFRFGRFFDREDWQMFIWAVFMILVSLYVAVDIFIKN